MGKRTLAIVAIAVTLCSAAVCHARDLGEILVEKGLITPEELRQAREEEKQKVAAEESRREMIIAKLPKWLDMVTLFGDLRGRGEGFYEDRAVARNRFRIRARLGMTVTPNDEVSATFRLVTGDPNDPLTANQTLSSTFTKKPVNFDQAYLTLRPGKTFGLEPGWGWTTFGKFSTNAYRVSELVWDDDLAPEGATETVALVDQRDGFLRGLKVNGFQWIVDEIANKVDPVMIGGQIVADAAVDDSLKMTFGVADYDFENLNKVARKFLEKSSSSFNSSLSNSNRLVHFGDGKISGFRSDFNVIEANGEATFFDVLPVPFGVFGDLAYNTQAPGRNVGVYTGAGIGKSGRDWYHNNLKTQGDWAFTYMYAWVEQDAVLSMFTYDDIQYIQNGGATQKGGTNVVAHMVRGDYMLLPNVQLTARVNMINAMDRDASVTKLSGNPTLFRTQLDVVLKF